MRERPEATDGAGEDQRALVDGFYARSARRWAQLPAAERHRRLQPRGRLGIEVDFSLPSARVIRTLERIIEWRGKPQSIRCDNGPKNISGTLLNWAVQHGIAINHIQPGKPQQSANIERYNRTVRYDWLAQFIFDSIAEVPEFATEWLWTYNNERPNMALGGITPKMKTAMAA